MCALSFFDEVDGQQKNRTLTFFFCCCRRTIPREQRKRIGTSMSSIEFDKDSRLFMVPEVVGPRHRLPSDPRFEREQWLQRRNSLSSQRAIHPHRSHHYYYDNHHPRPRYMVYSSYTTAPSTRYSSTLRSVSEGHCLDLGVGDYNSPESVTSSQSSSSTSSGSLATIRSGRFQPTTRHRSSSSGSPEKVGNGKVHGQDNGGVVGDGAGSVPEPHVLPVVQRPPPTWSPALQHAPLSSDPTIQALSTGSRWPLLHQKSSPPTLSSLQQRQQQSSDSTPGLATTNSPGQGQKGEIVVVTKATKSKGQEESCSGTTVVGGSLVEKQRPSTATTLPQSVPIPTTSPPPLPVAPMTANTTKIGSMFVPRVPSVAPPPPTPSPSLPTRSPGHHYIFPSPSSSTKKGDRTCTNTRTSSATSTSSTTTVSTNKNNKSLRRPSPLRSVHHNRQGQYYQPQSQPQPQPQPRQSYQRHFTSNGNFGVVGGNRYTSGQGQVHERYRCGSRSGVSNHHPISSVSTYSASSYGTTETRASSSQSIS